MGIRHAAVQYQPSLKSKEKQHIKQNIQDKKETPETLVADLHKMALERRGLTVVLFNCKFHCYLHIVEDQARMKSKKDNGKN